MKKEVILIIGIIIFSSIALAETLNVKTSTKPDIMLEFTEPVAVLSINLTKEGKVRPYQLIPQVQGSNTTIPGSNLIYASKYLAVPNTSLMNGKYTLRLVAMDFVNNTLRRNETINVQIEYMKIRISNPPYSVSPTKNFTLEITTENPARDCKYAYTDLSYEDANLNFGDTPSINNNKTFRKSNFNSGIYPNNLLTASQVEKKLYVYCSDMDKRAHPRVLNISYDTSAPNINAKFEPKIIVEKIDGKVFSKIKVSSDDRVVCEYSELNPVPTSNCTYLASSTFRPFTNYNQTNMYDYIVNPSQEIDVTAKTTTARDCKFEYKVRCKNRAGIYQAKYSALNISVDLMAAAEITKISPPAASKNTTVFLNFTTSKTARNCAYKIGDMSGQLDTSVDGKQHTKDLGKFDEGKYSVTVSCDYGEGSVQSTFPFAIDLSPPSTPVIKVPSAVCTKSISATFSATDAISSIAGFNYTLEGISGVLKTGFASGNPAKATVSGINFTHNLIYTFKAVARDSVGFLSAQGIGNSTVYDASGVSCDTVPPLIYITKNRTAEGYAIRLECMDKESACNNNSYTFSFSDDKNCTGSAGPLYYNSDYKGFVQFTSSSTYFCFEASDIAGNKATGYERIEIAQQEHCNNTIVDNDETDTDCGGLTTCQRCGIGKVCLADSDCRSVFCKSGFCSDVACDDLFKNGFETDVDCGGTACDKCGLNQSCIYNSDCTSNFCKDYFCAVASCTDSSENGDETDTDCGGSCPSKCANEKKCKTDADCTSGYCSGVGAYTVCAQRLGEIPSGPQNKVPVAKTAFVSLGILSMLGSIGYLSYLKFMPKLPRLPPPAPRAPPRAPALPPAAPAQPARPPARRESEFEMLEKLKGESKLERLGRGRGEEDVGKLKSTTDFERLGSLRKPTKLEKLGKGRGAESIERLKLKKKPKKTIDSLRK